MSKQEIESLLLQSVHKLELLDTSYRAEVQELKERIGYLEEVISSQKHMLNDSIDYIKKLEKQSQ
jgi:hypothetical protein